MKRSHLFGAVCACVSSFGMVTAADAALISRLDGQAAYDTVLNITWTANAGLSPSVKWGVNRTWAAGFSLGGYDDWRLASADVNGDGVVVECGTATEEACRDTEYGYMFHQTLGGSWGDDLTGTQNLGDVTLSGIQRNYWSGTSRAINPTEAWAFSFFSGVQNAGSKQNPGYGWAVADGDPFAPVPIPAAVWLFGSGLLGLVGIARRKKA